MARGRRPGGRVAGGAAQDQTRDGQRSKTRWSEIKNAMVRDQKRDGQRSKTRWSKSLQTQDAGRGARGAGRGLGLGEHKVDEVEVWDEARPVSTGEGRGASG